MLTSHAGSRSGATLGGTHLPITASASDSRDVRVDQARSLSDKLSQMTAIAELVARISSATSPESAAQRLVNDLRDYLDCQEVIVGYQRSRSKSCVTIAVSGRDTIEPQSEQTRLTDAVLQECIERDQMGSWPATEPRNRHALLAHRQFAENKRTNSVASFPLHDSAGQVQAALVVVHHRTIGDADVSFIRAAEQPLASALALQMRSYGNRVDRLVNRLLTLGLERKGQAIVATLAAIVLVLLCPMRYRVVCECELQPVIRRYVAAPFDGRLEKNFVEPGDVVAAGDVLARIDPRDVNWELSGKLAELHRVTKERAGYLAAHESGKVELAALEMERLNLEILRLQHQADNLEIRSPIDGIVVAGDLSKSEGVPLEKGRSLFEIAPLDRMVIDVWIPEDDMRFVEQGMPTRVSLDAFPLQGRAAPIERIHPQAELKNHENVFVAELTIDNADGALSPGMRGKAKVATVRRTCGWVLFHKAFVATLA